MKVTERNERKRNDKLRGTKRKKKTGEILILKMIILKAQRENKNDCRKAQVRKARKERKHMKLKQKFFRKKKEKNRK